MNNTIFDARFSVIYKCELLAFLFFYESRANWEDAPFQDVFAQNYDPVFDSDFMNPNFPSLDDE